MSAERLSATPRRVDRASEAGPPIHPWPGHKKRAKRAARGPESGIVARRRSLVPDPQVGRLALFTNARESAAGGREPPLLLLHGIHPSASAHELRLLFDAFRDERHVYAPDLPGFGSSERAPRGYTPELYVRAIESLIENAAQAAGAIDVVAIGLTCEYAAQAAVRLPQLMRSLTLISPTGFALRREQGLFERRSRRGKSLWGISLLHRLGIAPAVYRVLVSERALRFALRRAPRAAVTEQLVQQRYATTHQPGAEHAVLALLAGELVPPGNPQSVYTRVHCPTLIVHGGENSPGFGSLASFVKWREYFSTEHVDDPSLLHAASAQEVEHKLREFWLGLMERASFQGLPGIGAAAPTRDTDAASSY